MEKLGISNIKELVDFGLSAVELVSSLADGVSFGDLGPAMATAKKVQPALKDAHLAWPEYQDMDEVEALELESFVESEFDIPNDKVEVAIEQGLKVAVALRELASMFKKQ